MSQRLYLEFCGEDHTIDAGSSLTFGRRAQLEIDDNPYLHRVLGRFTDRGGTWRLEHLGRRSPIVVRDANGPSSSTVAPGASIGLTHGEFVCTFTAGPTRYELLGGLEVHEWDTDLLGPEGLEGTETLEWASVELNDDQRRLLVALCEHRLVDPGADLPLPSNREGATRLAWTMPKFNRKLDHLCEKLARAGVANVHGELGASAAERRRHLVDHALAAGLVTVGDLALLDGEHAA